MIVVDSQGEHAAPFRRHGGDWRRHPAGLSEVDDLAHRAAEAGLRPGDVLQEIDKTPVRSPDDVKKAMAKDGSRTHLYLILREGITHYVAIPPEGG